MSQNNKKTKILIVHQNFPGQFRHIVKHLIARSDIELLGIGKDTAPGTQGVKCVKYKLHRPVQKSSHAYLQQMEHAVLHGQAVARVLSQLKQQGFEADIILAHAGWGETLYLREMYPSAKIIHYCEWFYRPEGADLGFDPTFPAGIDDRLKVATWNAHHLLSLEQCDMAISPTQWQKSQYPTLYQDKITVIHDGINTESLKPNTSASLRMPNGKLLKAGDKVITYVARNLEPYRGFHILMQSLPKLLHTHPGCEVVIVGGDDVSYGGKPRTGQCWREHMLQMLSQQKQALDMSRVHFLGQVPYAVYQIVLQISAVHLYLTYPFVLSWSLLEAMATGCAIVASNTAPVKEVIQHGENGLLVDFFSTEAIVNHISQLLINKAAAHRLRLAAMKTAQEYTVSNSLQQYDDLLLGHHKTQHSQSTIRHVKQAAKTEVVPMRRKSDRLHELDLTTREIQVFKCLEKGFGDKEISNNLNISPKTVSHHVSNIIGKLGANSRTHAIAKVYNA